MITEVRISDPHVISLIEAEQRLTGEATATKTAGRLIVERMAIKEMTGISRMQTPDQSTRAKTQDAQKAS